MVQINTMDNKFYYVIYKNRFLILYIVFGFVSLIIETLVRQLLLNLINNLFANLFAILGGIFSAYFLNIKLNFKVPKQRVRLSILYFVTVSVLSIFLQFIIGSLTNIDFLNNRFILSGGLFLIAYFLHRKFAFKNYQKIGIAIHLNDKNNIGNIYNQIEDYPDFIHVDLIDETYNPDNISTDLVKLEEILQQWPGKKVQVHIMSKNPKDWIEKIKNLKVEIFFHHESSAKSNHIIQQEEIDFGIVIDLETSKNEIDSVMKLTKNLMVLCIPKPGFSGQKFDKNIDETIKQVIKSSKNENLKITLDGGMTPEIASNYSVDEIVSASFILGSTKSKIKIVDFQTSQKYEV